MRISRGRKSHKILIENPKDLLLLKIFLPLGSIVEGEVVRRIKKDYGERQSIERRKFRIKIRLDEKILKEDKLILKGPVVEAPEGIKGIQSISAGKNTTIEVSPPLPKDTEEYLKKLGRVEGPEYVVVLISSREAYVWRRGTSKYIRGVQSGKDIDEKEIENYVKGVASVVENLAENAKIVVIGGHGRVRENLKKLLEKKGFKCILESTSYIGYGGVKELFARGALTKVFGAERNEFEFQKFQEFLELAKEKPEKIIFGRDVLEALASGRVDSVAVSIESPDLAEEIFNMAEKSGAKVYLFYENREVLDSLKRMGGAIAKTRW